MEVCYEINNVEVWAMRRDPNGTYNYSIVDTTDNWNYNPQTRGWVAESNDELDNLEEHNDFDDIGWADTLMPATQCGHVTLLSAATRFTQQNLCRPIGSTGGN